MSRRVKDYVDVADHVSIDALIEKLTAIRDGLPEGSDAELRLQAPGLVRSIADELSAANGELDRYLRDRKQSAG